MSFAKDGFEVVNHFIPPVNLDAIRLETCGLGSGADGVIKRGGIRNAEKHLASVRALLASNTLAVHAERYLGGTPHFVRAIIFDKTPINNWLVSWHQDKTIAVSAKKNIEGWGPWSVKCGVHHVQPGMDVLETMVTFLLHIDASNEQNGCLHIAPGSHRFGLMSQPEIDRYIAGITPVSCVAEQGSALVMRPHILHSSRKAPKPTRRRVLHVEYSSYALPCGLTWA